MKSAGRTETNETEAGSQIFKTFGEVLDDALIEVVASTPGVQPNLLLSTRNATTIAPQVKHGGRIYQVQELPASILQATRLPREPVGYGTIRQLFTELRDAFEEHVGFSTPWGRTEYVLGPDHLVL